MTFHITFCTFQKITLLLPSFKKFITIITFVNSNLVVRLLVTKGSRIIGWKEPIIYSLENIKTM